MPEVSAIALMLDTGNAFGRGVAEGVVQYVNHMNDGRLVIQLPFGLTDFGPLRGWPFTGLIIQAQRPYQVEMVHRIGLPVVNVSVALGLTDVALPTVCSDNPAIGRLAAKYFLDRGFEHLAYLGEKDRYYSLVRGEGFVTAVREAGLKCETFHWKDADDRKPAGAPPPRRRRADALSAWLLRLPKPAAVFTSNDLRAAEALRACEVVGIRVPDMVSILGVDDEPYVHRLAPISSIPQPATRVGFQAAQLLDDLITERSPSPRLILIEPDEPVVTRHSTDTLPIRDPDVARALQYIQEHSNRSISVEDVIDHVSATRRTFERRFRQATGHSPLEEIHRVHIDRAKDLLAKTDQPIPDVALDSGFANVNRFGITFKAHVGLTPSSYRRQYRLR